jgi:protein TonB
MRISERINQPLNLSMLVHFSVAILIIGMSFFKMHQKQFKKINFTVFKEEPQIQEPPLVTAVKPPPPLVKPPEAPREVFGLNKNTLTSDSSEGSVSLKQGNTLAKAEDSETLQAEDAEALPVPTEEYLVSSMPILISDVKIPYPKEARDANKEGPVVMELLIDEKGQVRNVKLLEGPGYGLNEAALNAVRSLKFKPATLENKSVAVRIRYTYRFVLENK